MDKQAARAQWRGHQIKKAHAAGRGRTGGVGTQSRRAPGSARADFHELPTNYNRYDEEGEDPETAPQDCVPVQRSQGGNFQALLDEAALHVTGRLSRQQAFDSQDAVQKEFLSARGPKSDNDPLAFDLAALHHSLQQLPLHEVLGISTQYIPSHLLAPEQMQHAGSLCAGTNATHATKSTTAASTFQEPDLSRAQDALSGTQAPSDFDVAADDVLASPVTGNTHTVTKICVGSSSMGVLPAIPAPSTSHPRQPSGAEDAELDALLGGESSEFNDGLNSTLMPRNTTQVIMHTQSMPIENQTTSVPEIPGRSAVDMKSTAGSGGQYDDWLDNLLG
mmetsp:Transcript_17954/g.34320  ORF Transcript_17954/g.34320 Transcript_17954/m.34320 type:complete len:334 (+) Transcript_17954:83-1084(+)